MIITIDIETQGLNAQKYITGCLIKEGKSTPEIYRNKKELWNRVKQLGKKEAKRGKTLNVYSHNARYDTAGYINLTDKHLRFFCHRPFIWAYQQNKEEMKKITGKQQHKGKETIKFLDTMSIYNMSLERAGKLIGHKKTTTPEWLKKEKHQPTQKELKEAEKYMKQDTKVTMELIKRIQKELKERKVHIKRLYTINQIAIACMINKIKKTAKPHEIEEMFWNKHKGEARRTFRKQEIHAAYRGGRVEAFKTGNHKKTTYIDINSLYPYSVTKIKFPNLKTERKHYKPKKEIIQKIGISKAIIENQNNKLGILQIRTNTSNYYPKKGKILIGTWTHQELRLAQKEGYKIHDIEWSVTWEQTTNPIKKIMEEWYHQRKKTPDKFKNWFYKQLMNRSLGKMAQQRTGQYMFLDTIEKAQEYLQKGDEMINSIGTNVFYKRTEKEWKPKPYYMPIIPTLTNAKARTIMYKQLKKIPTKDLLYTDTDSIIFKGKHKNKYDIGQKLGQFKIEHENKTAKIYCKKTYSIGETIKIAGITQRNITIRKFNKGIITAKQMNTMANTTNIKQVGTFKKVTRNLKEQEKEHQRVQQILQNAKVYIDHDIKDITPHIKTIRQLCDT